MEGKYLTQTQKYICNTCAYVYTCAANPAANLTSLSKVGLVSLMSDSYQYFPHISPPPASTYHPDRAQGINSI